MSGDATRQQTLSRELSDFLIQLSIAIHRYAMYPDGHPSLGPSVENLVERLAGLLEERGQLSLGVARSQLVIEGVATETGNAVLKDLAGRLHRHHLGAVTFARGVYFEELADVLQLIAIEADRTGEPLGLNPKYRMGAWPHIRLYPLTYDKLQLVGNEQTSEEEAEEDDATRSARTRAAQLWVGLARAAIAAEATDDADAPHQDRDAPDPAMVAQAIQSHKREAAYDQVIVGYMLQIADELKSGKTPESVALKKRVSKMVSTLDADTLGHLMQMGGDNTQRRKFLLSASEGMAVDAVLDLVQAAGAQEEQTISNSMLRMLEKLSRHAESSKGQRRRVAETSMREQVIKLVRNWSLADPNPDAYRAALQNIAGSSPIFSVAPDRRFLPEPRRLIQMALEINVAGEALTRAVTQVIDEGDLVWLIETIAASPAERATTAIWKQMATPEQVAAILEREPLDVAALDHLAPRVGIGAAEPMLDVLAETGSTQTRRLLLDRLVKLGPEVAPLVITRATDDRWYVARNMLSILAELPEVPDFFDAAKFMDHTDPRVRREALRLLLKQEDTRERAICLGLADTDERTVRLAMTAAAQNIPQAAIPLLVSQATGSGPASQRATALRLLASTGSPAALDALLQITALRKTLFGQRLPPKSPEYLAALAGLHEFPQDARAREALAAAARAKDPEIVKAAVG